MTITEVIARPVPKASSWCRRMALHAREKWILFGYIGIAVALFEKFLRLPISRVPGGADGQLYCWFFGDIAHRLATGQSLFFTPDMNYPNGVNVMWNTALLLPAILSTPVTLLFGAKIPVLILMVVAPAISAWVCRKAILITTGSPNLIASLAALLYGFGPYMAGHSGQLNLVAGFYAPLVVMSLYRLWKGDISPFSAGIRIGTATLVTFLWSEEVVATVFIIGTVTYAWLLIGSKSPGFWGRRIFKCLAIAATINVVALAWPIYEQLFGRQALQGSYIPHQPIDISSLFIPTKITLLSTATTQSLNESLSLGTIENTVYLGPLLIVMVAVALQAVRWRDRLLIRLSGAFFCSVILSLGPSLQIFGLRLGIGPWAFFQHIPLVNGIIYPRISECSMLLACFAVSVVSTRVRPARKNAWAILLVGCLFSLAPNVPYDSGFKVPRSAFFASPMVQRIIPKGSVVAILPSAADPNGQAVAMAWQEAAGFDFRIVGGYGMFSDNGEQTYQAASPSFMIYLTSPYNELYHNEISNARESLLSTGVDYIVISDITPNLQLVLHSAEFITGCSPNHEGDAWICKVAVS